MLKFGIKCRHIFWRIIAYNDAFATLFKMVLKWENSTDAEKS